MTRTLTATLLLLAGAAHAQDAAAPAPLLGETKVDTRRATEPQTKVRMTGKELRRQGVTNLAEALVLLPEVGAHQNRRGGVPIDIRASRQRHLMVIIDGVTVDEPWNGNFDLASIPVTDIAELRLSTSPASPLDGIGGSGGVIEIVTVGAQGRPMVAAQAQGGTDHTGQLAATGRAAPGGVGVRVSTVGALSEQLFDVELSDGTGHDVNEARRQATVTIRVEKQVGKVTLRADGWGQHRTFVLPPDDELGAQVALIDREDSARGTLGADLELAGTTIVARGYAQAIRRYAIYYVDARQDAAATDEFTDADREGLMVEGHRGLRGSWRALGRVAVDSEHARSRGGTVVGEGRSSIASVAVGATGRLGPVVTELAIGVAAPLTDDAGAWPEGKLALTWAPSSELEVGVIGARKGRLPTLRERFAPMIGNPDLDTERSTFGEVHMTLRPPHLTAGFAAYARQQDDLIRIEEGQLENVGDILVGGGEVRVETGEGEPIGGGVAYNHLFAHSEDLGANPLDFVPRHRVDVYARAAYRAAFGGWARVRWTDDRIDQSMVLDAYTTLELSAWARVGRALLATLRVDNATDTDYLSRALLHAPGTTAILTLEGRWE